MAMRHLLITAIIAAVILNGSAMAQHVIMNSDTDNIMLCVDFLRSSIQRGNRDNIVMIMGGELTVGDTVLSQDAYIAMIDSVLRVASERGVVATKPPEITAAGFWDFSMDSPQAVIRDDSCFVTCELRLYATTTAGGEAYKADEMLVFVKHGKCWKLEEVCALFDFLTGSRPG
jgi:hypothetical protein